MADQQIVREWDPAVGEWSTRVQQESAGGGGITEITSTDMSVTITDPTGPTVDLSASGVPQTLAQVLAAGNDGDTGGMTNTGGIDTGGASIDVGAGQVTVGNVVIDGDGNGIDTGGDSIDAGGGIISSGVGGAVATELVRAVVAGTGTTIGVNASAKLGFYGVAPVALQTGVAVDAAGIHAALVALGLITA